MLLSVENAWKAPRRVEWSGGLADHPKGCGPSAKVSPATSTAEMPYPRTVGRLARVTGWPTKPRPSAVGDIGSQ